MGLIANDILSMLDRVRGRVERGEIKGDLRAGADGKRPARLRARQRADAADTARLWDALDATGCETAPGREAIGDPAALDAAPTYVANIERYIGTAKLPVGVIGPLRINGTEASGDYVVPLATTEAALVASYDRGAQLVTAAGGVSAAVLSHGVLRTPAFVFDGLYEAGSFVAWVVENADALKAAAEATTRHGRLLTIEPHIEVDTVFLICRYETGDAGGQNMVTVATQALVDHVTAHAPTPPRYAFVEANFSGDKKASYLGLSRGRGRKVSASVTIPNDTLRRHLRVEPDALAAYGRVAALGATMSGQLGAQAHYANALAALYIATGQDAACVAESAVGFTRMEPRENETFFSVTMPNVIVGTVGGGTGLPSQNAALRLMGLAGSGHAPALAEVTAATCLCGEISIIAAIAAGHFTRAHEKLARHR